MCVDLNRAGRNEVFVVEKGRRERELELRGLEVAPRSQGLRFCNRLFEGELARPRQPLADRGIVPKGGSRRSNRAAEQCRSSPSGHRASRTVGHGRRRRAKQAVPPRPTGFDEGLLERSSCARAPDHSGRRRLRRPREERFPRGRLRYEERRSSVLRRTRTTPRKWRNPPPTWMHST